MTTLIYPDLRKNIEAAAEALADIDMQQRAWLGREPHYGNALPTFDDTVHWLFDDSGLDEGPEACVGFMFYDHNEAASVKELMASIDQLFQTFGLSASIETYLNAPEWISIVSNARHCVQTLRTGGMTSRPGSN